MYFFIDALLRTVPGATLPTHVGRAPVTVNPNPVLPRTIESVWRLPFAHCCSVSISISDVFTDQYNNALIRICTSAEIKAATDPKNWIRDPAGSDPDPDPLTHGTSFHKSKIPQNVYF